MPRIKVKFEKQTLQVGLSAEIPLTYRGPEEKYELADWLAPVRPSFVTYEKDTLLFEFQTTSDELPHSPERARCHHLVRILPESALPEVEEELAETYQHYLAIAEAKDQTKLLTAREPVRATVVEIVKR